MQWPRCLEYSAHKWVKIRSEPSAFRGLLVGEVKSNDGTAVGVGAVVVVVVPWVCVCCRGLLLLLFCCCCQCPCWLFVRCSWLVVMLFSLAVLQMFAQHAQRGHAIAHRMSVHLPTILLLLLCCAFRRVLDQVTTYMPSNPSNLCVQMMQTHSVNV